MIRAQQEAGSLWLQRMDVVQIIDDEPDHARLLDLALRQARYRTNVAADGELGLHDVFRLRPIVVLLDVMLPGTDGHEVCRRIKADGRTSTIPVIMMSALGTVEHRLKGFELGADDYVVKPFSPKEVVARVQALVRRAYRQDMQAETYLDGRMVFGEGWRTVSLRGMTIDLSDREAALLRRLALREGRIVSRDMLMTALWGMPDPVYVHTLDRLALSLDRKLAGGGYRVQSIPGVGYKLACPANAI